MQGIGNTSKQAKLQSILNQKKGSKVVTGMANNTSYVLCVENELYAFGSNESGELVRLYELLIVDRV